MYSDDVDSLKINESTFLQNSAVWGSGGGVYCTMSPSNLNSAFMAIIASMFSQNSATDGGGVGSAVSSVMMRESTFSANSARKVSLSFIGTTFVHMRTGPDTFPLYTPWQVLWIKKGASQSNGHMHIVRTVCRVGSTFRLIPVGAKMS